MTTTFHHIEVAPEFSQLLLIENGLHQQCVNIKNLTPNIVHIFIEPKAVTQRFLIPVKSVFSTSPCTLISHEHGVTTIICKTFEN